MTAKARLKLFPDRVYDNHMRSHSLHHYFDRHVFCLWLAAVSFLCVLFAPIRSSAYFNQYVIRHYQVDIIVNEDNSFDITETIDAYFDEGAGKHGIIRSIPLKNTVVRTDGTRSTNYVTISDTDVNEPFRIERENGNYNIRIGSASETVEGDVRYVIRYRYDIGKDPLKGKDEFYFNIIGTQWDTDIESVDFTVTFPKDFDPSTIGFSWGYAGSMVSEDVMYKVSGRTVEGYCNHSLGSYRGLTMRMELPEGYFVHVPDLMERSAGFLSAIPLFGVLAAALIYLLRIRRAKPVEPVSFYPPDGLNPLDIGYLYDGEVDRKDVTSLLIYLANKGYLEIIQGSAAWKIRLLKDAYEGNNPQEQEFFLGLRDRAKGGIVKFFDLADSFYTVVSRITKSYLTKERKRVVMEPVTAEKFLTVLTGVVMSASSMMAMVYFGTESTTTALIAGAIGTFLVLFYSIILHVALIQTRTGSKAVGGVILFFIIMHFLVMFGVFGFLMLGFDRLVHTPYMVIGPLGLILGAAVITFGLRMKKRTAYGNEMLGRIRGFRYFLEMAEKPQLEALVRENPSYFYDILPYTYVLGLSDTWISQFDKIAMAPPSWYSGPDFNEFRSVNDSIRESMREISGVMTSSPSSSSSSGGYSSSSSSGGGSFGGGSGGGGGSSW